MTYISIKYPKCNLLGITTVGGESEKRAAIADTICQTTERVIPIIAGLDTTMQPVPIYPTPDGARALNHWKHNNYEKADAPAFLYQKIKEHPHEIVLIGIGNMINIATLFYTYPEIVELLKGLYVMNGYFANAWLKSAKKLTLHDPLVAVSVFHLDICNFERGSVQVETESEDIVNCN